MTRLAPLLLCLLLAAPSRAAEPEPQPEPDPIGLEAGQRAPWTGVHVPPRRMRELLAAETRDKAAPARETLMRQGLELDTLHVRVDLLECRTESEARERQRAACETERVPAQAEPAARPWGGWPWVTGAGGVVVGVVLAVLVVEVAR